MGDLFQPVTPIKVEAPPVSLLTVSRRLTGLPQGTKWNDGTSHLPNGCTPAAFWPDCEVDPTPDPKCAPQTNSGANFRPFAIYLPDGCDEKPFWAEDWIGRSTEALDAFTPWAISRELDTGAASGNPSLRSTATDLAGPAVTVDAALSTLVRNRVDAGLGGMMTAHVPAWLIPSFYDHYLLDAGSGPSSLLGMVKVSPGPGYTGASPAGAAAASGQGYIYISGPVEWEMSPVTALLTRDEQQPLINRVEVYAERFGYYRFDPCGVFAVLAKVG